MTSWRGQKTTFRHGYSALGLSLNSTSYYGDLAPKPNLISTDISMARPGFGGEFLRRVGPRLAFATQLSFSAIKGADLKSADQSDVNSSYRYKRNASFRNRLKEFSIISIIDLINHTGPYNTRPLFIPYAFFGVSIFAHCPKAQVPMFDLSGNPLPQSGEWVSLRPLGTEGQYSTLSSSDANFGIKPYSLVQITFPFGFGVRYKLNSDFDLAIDFTVKYLFTDYIDDVSRNYVDLGKLNSDLARALSYRTNELRPPSNPYTYVGADGLTYTVEAGYGSEYKSNIRGSSNNNDVLFTTSLRINYLIRPSIFKAKRR
jgi:hypothetical protein